LSGLTYQMKEMRCQRGQEIYKEGVDPANKIYLVKRGEFKTLKKVPNKQAVTEASLMDIGLFVKNEHKNDYKLDHFEKDQAIDKNHGDGISVQKFKQM